jgi:hypothetical protein
MVLSTLIPTLLHFLFALYALISWPMMSMHKAHLDTFWDYQESRRAIFNRQTWVGALSMLLFSLVVAAIYQWGDSLRGVFTLLWHIADGILDWVDPGYVSPV